MIVFLLATASAWDPLFTCGTDYGTWSTDSHWRLQARLTGTRTFYSGLDDQDVIDAVTDGFQVWSDPTSCCSSFRAIYDGTTAASGTNTNDAVNAVSFEENSWDPAFGGVNSTIAVTLVGAIGCNLFADQVYNAVGFDFTVTDTPGFGDTDLQSIAAHENGHWLGLGHTPVTGSTMFASYSGGIGPRSLGSDDEAGVCALYPGTCGPPEVCDDGIDNDLDGAPDCADLDCDGQPGCIESACDNGSDDEGDGLTDCDDPDCADATVCVCPAIDVLPCGTPVSGTTVGGTDTTSDWACANWTTTGPEAVYAFSSPVAGPATVTLSGLTADLDLFVTDDANGTSCNPGSCVSQGGPATTVEVLTFDVEADETVFVVADGWDGAAGSYTLEVACPPGWDTVPDPDGDADVDADSDTDTDTDTDTEVEPDEPVDFGGYPAIGSTCGCASGGSSAPLALGLLPFVLRRRR